MEFRYILLVFSAHILWCAVLTDASQCSKRCSEKFTRCYNLLRRRRGGTNDEAYSICREEVDGRMFRECEPGCEDTKEMRDMSGNACSRSCDAEFKRCHDFNRNRRRKNCGQAYNICRRQLDGNNRRFIGAGCVPSCVNTKRMDNLQTCGGNPSARKGTRTRTPPGTSGADGKGTRREGTATGAETRKSRDGSATDRAETRGSKDGATTGGAERRTRVKGTTTDGSEAQASGEGEATGSAETEKSKESMVTGADCIHGMTFTSNNGGRVNMPILCKSNLCDTFKATRGDDCEVHIDIPQQCAGDAGRSCPLLFHFHSAGGSANAVFYEQVRREGVPFIGIYPQGVNRMWNIGFNTDLMAAQVDDGELINAIVSTLKEYYNWDGLKFAVGSGDGGLVATRIAVNSGLGFNGVVSMSAIPISSPKTSGVGKFNHNTITKRTTPIAYLSLHGTDNALFLSNGGEFLHTGYIYSSVADTLKKFATLNGCIDGNNPPSSSSVPATNSFTNEQTTATVTKYDCGPKVPVVGVMVTGGRHSIAHDIDGKHKNDYIFDWLVAVRNEM